MLNLLNISVGPKTYQTIMGLKITAFVLIGLCALTIIVTILMQTSADSSGSNALTGSSETYYAQNKGSTKEAILKKITIAAAIIIFIMAIFLTVMLKFER